MLLDVAVDPKCLADERSSVTERDAILELIERYGQLSKTDGDLKAIRAALSQNEWKRWCEVLGRVPTRPRKAPLSTNVDPACVVPPGVVLLGDELAPTWQAACEPEPEEGVGFLPESLREVVYARSVSRSVLKRERDDWSRKPLSSADTGFDFWNRIKPLFLASAKLTIVDRYMFKLGQRDLEALEAKRGLMWLLERMGEHSKLEGIDLVLVGEQPEQLSSDSAGLQVIADHCAERCQHRALTVKVISVPNGRFGFGSIHHDRHLRFSNQRCSRVVEIGNSLDAITSEGFSRSMTFAYHVVSSSAAATWVEIEEKLIRLAEERGQIAISGSDRQR